MVFDIAITLFIIIGLIIGIFRNPIMSIIHTVLFVCFTFLFTPILGTFMPTILEMNNINLADLASSAANAISMVNNEIISFGENIGVKLLTIPSLYTTPSFLEGALKGISNSLTFLVSSILSLIISYLVSWIFYLLIKRYYFEFNKVKRLKFYIKAPISFSFTFFFIFFFLSFTFSPYQNIKNSFDQLYLTFDKVNIMEKIENEYNDITSLINNIKEKGQELSSIDEKINKLDKNIEEYYDNNMTYFIESYSLKEEKDNLIVIIDESLTDSSITNKDKIKLNEYKSSLLLMDKKFENINDLIFKDDETIYNFSYELTLLSDEINVNKDKFISEFNDFTSSVNKLKSIDNDLNKYLEEIDNIRQKFIKSSWYDFLFSIDYGYMSFLYNGNIYSLKEEVNNFIINFDNLLNENISLVKSYFNKEVKKGNDKLYEIEEKIEDYNEDITLKEKSFNEFSIKKEENNKDIEELLVNLKEEINKIKEDLSLNA